MKVVFRVDSSSEIGIGNIMRCLSLADKLKQQNHEVVFVCRALPGNINLLINHAVLALPTDNKFISDDLYLNLLGSTQEKDAEQTITVIPSNVDLLTSSHGTKSTETSPSCSKPILILAGFSMNTVLTTLPSITNSPALSGF